ncbi:MAG: hypothetical protein ACKVU2_14665 [Saprospiraceae bacterium]
MAKKEPFLTRRENPQYALTMAWRAQFKKMARWSGRNEGKIHTWFGATKTEIFSKKIPVMHPADA